MKLRLLGIGIFLTLAVLACSLGVPATSTSQPAEQTPLNLATVKPAEPTLAPPHLTSGPPTPAPTTSVSWGLKHLTTLQNNRLGQIHQVTWRPDGKALLVHLGKNLHLFETATWQSLWNVPADYAQLVFSPDGSQIYALSGNQFQHLDAATGAVIEIHSLDLRGGLTALTPDGRFVAETLGGEISLYAVQTGQPVRALPADLNSGPISDLAFSADGQWVVAGSQAGDLQAWEAHSGQRTLFRPAVIPSPVYECDVRGAIQRQPVGNLLVVCSYPADDYQTIYYQAGVFPASASAAGSSVVIRDSAGRGYSDFTVNADRSRLAVTSAGDVEIWSAFGGSRLRSLPKAAGLGMTFSPAAKNQLAIWTKRAIQVWDINTGALVNEWTTPGTASPPVQVAFSPAPERRLLTLARENGLVELWDIARVEKIAEWQANSVTALAFTPDGARLAVAQASGAIAVFKLDSAIFTPQFELQAGFRVFDLAFNPQDLRQLYVVGDSHDIHVWDVSQQHEMTAWPGSNLFTLTSLALRGDTLAAGTIAGRIPVWRAPGGEPFTELSFSSLSTINSLSISPDESQVIFAQGNDIQVWQLSPQEQIRKVYFKNPPSLSLHPDGCTLAVRTGKSIEMLDAAQFTSSVRLESPSNLTSNLAFSSDGFLLAAGNEDGEIILWGRQGALEALPEPPPAPHCGAFSPPPTPTATLPPTSTPIPSATPVPSATPLRTATFTPTPPVLTRTLSLADPPMRGEDVLLLQERLFELGYTEVGTPDGIFGKMTDSAVRRFQERNGLEADGYLGPKTWDKLFSDKAVGAK
jgi:WD40 repeat protein